MQKTNLGVFKRLLYAFTCLFGSEEDIKEILPTIEAEKKEPEEKKVESLKEGKQIVPKNKPVAYTFGIMDRFGLIKVDNKLLEGFVTIFSKGNHPIVKQELIILNLKNMIDKEIFFENTNGYGKICSISETEVIVTMQNIVPHQQPNMFTTFKFEPEIIHVQKKDIGIQRVKKGSKFIDFVGVNMDAIKKSYLRWTRDWPLISSMVKKN